MSEKKRTRHGDLPAKRPNKKIAIESLSKPINVSTVEDEDDWTPVLGLNLPFKIAFKAYAKSRPNASRPGPEILLHSSAHPRLDFTAREEISNGCESHVKHYVGVYDPESQELQLVRARKLVVRSTLCSAPLPANDESYKDERSVSAPLSARNNLGLAFGTKKAQKAIRAVTANAIQASPSKSKSKDQSSTTLDPLASAVVSSMAASSSTMYTRDEMQANIDKAKPRPRPNLDAETPAEVYPVEELVGGVNVLQQVGVKEWIDKVNAGQDVQTKSMFVARRLKATVHSGDIKKLKILRYLLLLVEWCKSLKPKGKQGRRVPPPEDISHLIAGWGSDTVNGVARRFAQDKLLNKWHYDNLITHILALTLVLDNFVTDSHDIREDLRLEVKEISKYYSELGCTIARLGEAERKVLGIQKEAAMSHHLARLRLPLVFPKTRLLTGRKKR